MLPCQDGLYMMKANQVPEMFTQEMSNVMHNGVISSPTNKTVHNRSSKPVDLDSLPLFKLGQWTRHWRVSGMFRDISIKVMLLSGRRSWGRMLISRRRLVTQRTTSYLRRPSCQLSNSWRDVHRKAMSIQHVVHRHLTERNVLPAEIKVTNFISTQMWDVCRICKADSTDFIWQRYRNCKWPTGTCSSQLVRCEEARI